MRAGLLIVALVGIIFAGCNSLRPCPNCAAVPLSGSAAVEEPTDAGSVYPAETLWTTDSGTELKLTQLAGQPCVLSFFFASCSLKCPITAENMRRVQAELPREMRERVKFVLITFDPEADSVAVLQRYRSAHRLAGTNWLLLRGNNEAVRQLAARLGYSFNKTSGGGFNHDSVVTVLDAAGRPVFRHAGLYGGVNELQLSVRRLFQDKQ